MATYLALSQRLRQESEVPGSGPSATTNQTGQLARLVQWIAAAYNDIQLKNDWRWLRRPFTFDTVADDSEYPYTVVTDVDATGFITRFGHWWAHDCDDPYLAYLTSGGVSGQYRLLYMPWEDFKRIYRFGTQTSGQPIHVSVDHQNNLVLGPKPSGIYTITGDFQRSPQILAADGDIPEMPTQFHDLIWLYALEKYGANSVATELFARAQLEGSRLMSALNLNQLPRMGEAGTLL